VFIGANGAESACGDGMIVRREAVPPGRSNQRGVALSFSRSAVLAGKVFAFGVELEEAGPVATRQSHGTSPLVPVTYAL